MDALALQLEDAKRHLLGFPVVQPSPAPPMVPTPRSMRLGSSPTSTPKATGVQDILLLVFAVLDPMSTHYARWRDQVLLTLQRYALVDYMVLLWLFGTLTVELQDIVHERGTPLARSGLPSRPSSSATGGPHP